MKTDEQMKVLIQEAMESLTQIILMLDQSGKEITRRPQIIEALKAKQHILNIIALQREKLNLATE